MNAIDIKTLPFSAKAQLCWGFFWRGIVVSICSAICGAVLGGIVGFILGFIGAAKGAVFVGGILGLISGAFFLYVLVRWLLTSNLGRFRLVLVDAHADA